ncbi:MAG: hypothetical protein HC945_03770 [Nitrosarchaeum sp.]|nr:hypothetical protein [Nitrosarchaeum sp.]
MEWIRRSQSDVGGFCNTQETIFKSCGMPMRFQVAVASAFVKFGAEALSARSYRKSMVRGLGDLMSDEMQSFLRVRSELFDVFRGGDRVRFFRQGEADVRKVLEEWKFLLSTAFVPVFTYDFRGVSGDLRLTSFFGRGDSGDKS